MVSVCVYIGSMVSKSLTDFNLGPPVLDEDDEEVDELTLSTSQPRPSEDDTASIKSERTDTPTPTNTTSRIS